MSVSVRIEGEAFGDERYDDLAEAAGLIDADHARGKMLRIWRQCTIEQTETLMGSTIARILGPNGVEALVVSRLGERIGGKNSDKIRIKGTAGRIEWLAKLRDNGKFGKLGGRPKRNPHGFADETPPAPAPAPAPVQIRDQTPIVPRGDVKPTSGPLVKPSRKRKAKPHEPTPDELASVRVVLDRLTAKNGVRYSGSAEHTRLVVNQLRAGVTEMDLRAVVGYCADAINNRGWANDDKMRGYLRPETLFGPQTISRYLDAARTWFDTLPSSTLVSPPHEEPLEEPDWMRGGDA
jgi:uncharacterized phage protein (TIGR02220 family)